MSSESHGFESRITHDEVEPDPTDVGVAGTDLIGARGRDAG